MLFSTLGGALLASTLSVSEDLAELKTLIGTYPGDDVNNSLDLRHIRLSVLLADSTDALRTFLTWACQLFDTCLGSDVISKETARDLLLNHIFLSPKVSLGIQSGLFVNGIID
jgi:hypothetical protein